MFKYRPHEKPEAPLATSSSTLCTPPNNKFRIAFPQLFRLHFTSKLELARERKGGRKHGEPMLTVESQLTSEAL